MPFEIRRISVIAALLVIGDLDSSEPSRINLSIGTGLLNVANMELGRGLTDNFSLEASLGTSLFLGTASIFLDYDIHAANSNILKIGAGPSASFACGHAGCGVAKGMDARTKYVFFPHTKKSFGYYGNVGYFIGSGNLFGNNPTHLPHLGLGLNWRL